MIVVTLFIVLYINLLEYSVKIKWNISKNSSEVTFRQNPMLLMDRIIPDGQCIHRFSSIWIISTNRIPLLYYHKSYCWFVHFRCWWWLLKKDFLLYNCFWMSFNKRSRWMKKKEETPRSMCMTIRKIASTRWDTAKMIRVKKRVQ